MNMTHKTIGLFLKLALTTLVAVSPTFAQEAQGDEADVPWRVLVYSLQENNAEQEVTDLVRQGFLPVGFEIEPEDGSLSILVVRRGDLEIEGWLIADYTDWNALEAEITGSIQSGLIPMDISRYGDAIAILWVQADIPVEGWRIHAAENTVTGRIRAVNQFQEQGFTVWGVSVHADLAWYLFMKQTGEQPTSTVAAYAKDANELQNGMVASSRDGWLPNAFAITAEAFLVSYVK